MYEPIPHNAATKIRPNGISKRKQKYLSLTAYKIEITKGKQPRLFCMDTF